MADEMLIAVDYVEGPRGLLGDLHLTWRMPTLVDEVVHYVGDTTGTFQTPSYIDDVQVIRCESEEHRTRLLRFYDRIFREDIRGPRPIPPT